ncbi:MAG: pseudaminic acid cytidylyltransferase [Lachnospiraceae bacterium]|jgi:N-acylneuraminate cytidylyltransferase|nr:pseudaminic acid cytidylyltransferase [Lachnospiraceae bacterium]
MNTIAIITARGGSKRIPRKNIRDFCGKPMIAYAIEVARAAAVFDAVLVSTDDEEIVAVAKAYGATVPFLRSPQTADDFATTSDVLMEALDQLSQQNERPERFCCLYPTCPLLAPARLREAMALLDSCDGVIPVVPFSYPPQRAFVIEDGLLRHQYPEHARTRSQDLPPIYHDAGQFYAYRTAAFLAAGSLFVPDLRPLVLTEMEVQDIDTEEDWKLAEMKYEYIIRNA